MTEINYKEALIMLLANQKIKKLTPEKDFLDNLKRDGFWVHDHLKQIQKALKLADRLQSGKFSNEIEGWYFGVYSKHITKEEKSTFKAVIKQLLKEVEDEK